MKRVRLARLAQRDFKHASEWYETQGPGLGARFVASVDRVLANVGENPGRFPVVFKEARRAMVGRFPYGIFFVERESYVRVVAIVHLKRNPKTWQDRV